MLALVLTDSSVAAGVCGPDSRLGKHGAADLLLDGNMGVRMKCGFVADINCP